MNKEKEVVIEVSSLCKYFRQQSSPFYTKWRNLDDDTIKAVNKISLSIREGETVGLVGESGSGKTTLGRLIVRLCMPNNGKIFLRERDIYEIEEKEFRSSVQMVFQNPDVSLNNMMKVYKIMEEAIRIGNKYLSPQEVREETKRLFSAVGLNNNGLIDKYPREMCGGEKRRLGIARILAVKPKFIVLDEPIAEIDVSTQLQIIEMLQKLKTQNNLTFLLISHDLDIIRNMCDRIAVMYMGRIVEVGSKDDIIKAPGHPYTMNLLEGNSIHVYNNFKNETCNYSDRCTRHQNICADLSPPLITSKNSDHQYACHNPLYYKI